MKEKFYKVSIDHERKNKRLNQNGKVNQNDNKSFNSNLI